MTKETTTLTVHFYWLGLFFYCKSQPKLQLGDKWPILYKLMSWGLYIKAVVQFSFALPDKFEALSG